MKFSERKELNRVDGLVVNQHPAVVVTVGIMSVTEDLNAGSLITIDENGGYVPWGDGQAVCGVLVEDIKCLHPDQTFFRSVLIHGCVNRDRLFGQDGVSAIDGKTFKNMMAHGIYPVQSFDE